MTVSAICARNKIRIALFDRVYPVVDIVAMYSFSQSDICTSDFYVISTHLFTGAPVIPICFRTKDVTVFICSVGCPTVATESSIIVRHNNRGYFTFLSAVIFSLVKGTFKHVADARAGRSQRISQFGTRRLSTAGLGIHVADNHRG